MTRFIAILVCVALALQSGASLAKSRSSSGGGPLLWATGALVAGAVAYSALQQKQCKKAMATGPVGADIPRPCYSDQVLERSYGTGTLRGQLDIERQAAGIPPNPDDCDGHHIVPQKERRPWAEKAANSARAILKKCEIDLNSAQNGVYLPRQKEGSQNCEGRYHGGLHTKEYYDYVARRLRDADVQFGCDGVKDALSHIKSDLVAGVIW